MAKKLETTKTIIEIAKTISDMIISHKDERARREKEKHEIEEANKKLKDSASTTREH